MPLAKIICKRHFHMSGEMVPPQYSPSHAARSFTIRDRAKCPRRRARSFDEGVTKSRGKRGSARRLSSFYSLEQSFVFAFSCGFLKPKNNASNRNGGDCKCNRRRYLKYPFPRDERSLTVRGPVRGGCQRARSFDSRITVSRGKRGSARCEAQPCQYNAT